jgi:hypothetical protein
MKRSIIAALGARGGNSGGANEDWTLNLIPVAGSLCASRVMIRFVPVQRSTASGVRIVCASAEPRSSASPAG